MEEGSARPLVSVVIAAYGAAAEMPDLMGALAGQTLPRERFEVLLVDDCSTDGTGAAAEATGVPRVLRTERNSGAYVARNVGLAAARAGVVATTDADCVPEPEWLEAGLADLDRLDADLVGGRIDVPLPARPNAAQLVDFARYLDQERALREGGFAATANLFVRRRVFDSIGAFNERVISGGDREFCLRATDAGFRLVYSERAAVRHEPRASARELVRKTRRMGIGRAQMNRHGHPLARRPRIWTSPGAYLMRPGVYGMERLAEQGVPVGRARFWRMTLAEYAYVQLPLIWGNFLGSLRLALRR